MRAFTLRASALPCAMRHVVLLVRCADSQRRVGGREFAMDCCEQTRCAVGHSFWACVRRFALSRARDSEVCNVRVAAILRRENTVRRGP